MHAFPSYFKKSSTKKCIYNFTCKCSRSESFRKIFVSFYIVSPVCLSRLILQKFIPLCKRTRIVDIQFHLQILTKLVLKFLFPAFAPAYIYIYIYMYACDLQLCTNSFREYFCKRTHISGNNFADAAVHKVATSFFFGFSPMVAVWNMHAFLSYFQTS